MSNLQLAAKVAGSVLLQGAKALADMPAGFPAAALVDPTLTRAYAAAVRLAEKKKPVELVLIANEAGFDAKQTQRLRDALEYGSTNSVAPFAEELLEAHRRKTAREIIANALEAFGSEQSRDEITTQLVTRLRALDDGSGADTEMLSDVLPRLEAALDQPQAAAVRTGFAYLDRVARFRRGALVVIAAETGKGKSTLAVNIAEHVAKRGEHALVHSIEMSSLEIVARMVSRNSGVAASSILGGEHPTREDRARISKAINRLSEGAGLPFELNTRRHNLEDICRITERSHRQSPLSLIVVDYLQLVSVTGGRGFSEEQRIGTVSNRLKQLAMQLNVPIIGVAQLNREVSKRVTKEDPFPEPRLSDLRGSGRLEHDADVVAALQQSHGGIYRLLMLKQRSGKPNVVVSFIEDLEHAQFIENEHQEPV